MRELTHKVRFVATNMHDVRFRKTSLMRTRMLEINGSLQVKCKSEAHAHAPVF